MVEEKLTQEKLEKFRDIIPVNIGHLVDCDKEEDIFTSSKIHDSSY